MTDAQIKDLVFKRGTLKRTLTNNEQNVNAINDNSNLNLLNPAERLRKLEETWTEFQDIQSQLEFFFIDDNDNLKVHELERTEFENRYFNLTGRLQFYNDKLKYSNAPISSGSSSTQPIQDAASNRSQNITPQIKLPTINLPTFSGSYDTWLGFSDTFKSIIHQNEKIPTIQKLHYLKSCLKDEAAAIIDAIETSSTNYQVAWDLLEERYNNRRFIVESHTKALLELPASTKEFSIRAILDHVQKHVRALRALNIPVDNWDTILISIIKGKLNQFNRDKWEDSTAESNLPTMKDMFTFLQRRAQLEETRLEEIQIKSSNKSENQKSNSKSFKKSNVQHSHVTTQSKPICYFCKGNHAIYSCQDLLKLSITERLQKVKDLSLCMNCLRQNHQAHKCQLGPCRKCKEKHNSLLHPEETESQSVNLATDNNSSVMLQAHGNPHSLISTAIVDIKDSQGNFHSCRILLDSGSQSHYITEKMAASLDLKASPVNINVTGFSLSQTSITKSISSTMKSRVNKYEAHLDFFVVPRITSKLPSISIKRSQLSIPQHIKLADPEFYKSADIDALIGVQLFYKLLCIGQLSIPGHDAILQKTRLGWIVAGNIFQGSSKSKTESCHLVVNSTTQPEDIFSQFWELEQVPNKKFLSQEEQACEAHFINNTKRLPDGRYVVNLPFNEIKDKLGQSFYMAKKRFNHLEMKLERNPILKQSYAEFINEYENLGHMSEDLNENSFNTGYFLPHHAIIKEEKLTSKIRVVFNGSAKDSRGFSLNNALMVGPTVQNDLFTIYTRFRLFMYVLSADLEKMYRQVLVAPEDFDYQKILWRDNPDKPIKIFQLKTVTYSTASAPYLATRVLLQLANDEGQFFPLASQALRDNFYVDDCLTGAKTKQRALELRDELIEIVKKGGFSLRKWASNCPDLVNNLDSKSTDSLISLKSEDTIKTLGISWVPDKDKIIYLINNLSTSNEITKRTILSDIARIFDPLGLLSPIIVCAKLMIQHLWKNKIDWDQCLSNELRVQWLEFKNQLPLLNGIEFNRCLFSPEYGAVQLHGFCDASERAYAACIYLRSTNKTGEHESHLVCSKSRIAPIHPVTLPRLELCAALLLSRLVVAAKQAFNHFEIEKQVLWSDSTIALCWIKTPPHTLKTFVANRVGEILESTQSCEWRHVPTLDNPADLPSRGVMPKDFSNIDIWRHGPQWLVQDEDTWPQLELKPCSLPELRKPVSTNVFATVTDTDAYFLSRFSSIRTLTRVIAYCRRFCHNAKGFDRLTGELTMAESNEAHDCIIKLIQKREFSQEDNQLSNGNSVNNKSKLLNLDPFLEKGILRVGGRLSNSDLNFNQKHPIVLPRNHSVTSMIIREQHEKLQHAGVQATLYAVRELYWPIDGRNITRKVLRQCVTCVRVNPQGFDYKMGNLPADRVDYCGPFFVKEKRYRNTKNIKCYVAVFVCFITRAVHLELVSDLTTDAFLGTAILTFEQLQVYVYEIEAILNSRPLTPISSDPNDLRPLTPGHFLIGCPLTTLPEENLLDVKPSRLSLWQHAQQMRQHFWQRWQKEYVNELITRSKWKSGSSEIKIGTLVVLKEDNLPPLHWK
ncbi:uncharacterized protein LOC127286209 [Leptopilina boulardi]|uniref:uncharacterized protein LOC127286209 n=1 Tax=Leptopilina boulardi TaxID=63433 RepID=UPI0021F5C940|nr:uncharacterized protein LOC127286209 [Leptopilina boulardi]